MVPAPSKRVRDTLIIATSVAAVAIFTAAGGWRSFPLDDAWIYQTYARNLALYGQWAFVPGQPSTGSTSILWTLLLAPGTWLGPDAFGWARLAGAVSLAAAGLAAARLVDGAERPWLALGAGLAVVTEWHLVWAAASGMETAFFAAMVLGFWLWLVRHDPASHTLRNGTMTGLWGGALMLARPEGVLALGVAGLYALLSPGRVRDRVRWGLGAGLGFAMVLLPFVGFNIALSGEAWPNTFYAKQTEYAVLWGQPYLARLLAQAAVLFAGPLVLLLPGVLVAAWRLAREGRWLAALPLGWVVLHWAAYAARLPVTYQHGRYAMPAAAVLAAYGVWGLGMAVRPRDRRAPVRLGSQAWLLSAAALFPLWLGLIGLPAYVRDARFIDAEMVATAQWVAANVPPGATVAAHDIGALGYFAPRPLVDLAGLASPEAVPYMHDADGLAAFVVRSNAAVLVAFPQWNDTYRTMLASPAFEPVWSAAEAPGYSPTDSGLGPMTVYRVSRDAGG